MSLTLRGTKGSKLTISEMDNNLTYLEGLLSVSGSAASFTLPDTTSPGQTWILLGTWNTAQTGHTLRMTLSAHAGYNAGVDQNQSTDFYFATSNGISTNPSVAGYYANGSAEINVNLGSQSSAPDVFRVVQSNTNTYLFYGRFAQWAGNSHYTLTTSGTTSWVHSGTIVPTPSGTYLDITPIPSKLDYFIEAYSTANYTLPGTFTDDDCRYSIISSTANVPNSWFDTSSYSFTPQKAGYWEIKANYDIYRGSNIEAAIVMRKNGSQVAVSGGFGIVTALVTKTIYMNGTTDSIKVVNVGNDVETRPQSQGRSWFQARLVS